MSRIEAGQGDGLLPTDSDLLVEWDPALKNLGIFRVRKVELQARDFDDTGDGWLILYEKRGKTRRLEGHHQVREALRAYMAAASIEPGSRTPSSKARQGTR